MRSGGAGAPSPASGGTISGKVTYTGTPPKMKPIDMAKEPSCAKQHTTPVMTENVATGPDSSLQYVVVYISAGDSGGAAPTQTGPLRPEGLPVYAARAANATRASCCKSTMTIRLPTTSTRIAKVNPEWNKSQPAGSPPIDTKYDKPEFIPVKCNIHPWMHGYFAVLNTSHYAVTGQDGSFSLKGPAPRQVHGHGVAGTIRHAEHRKSRSEPARPRR